MYKLKGTNVLKTGMNWPVELLIDYASSPYKPPKLNGCKIALIIDNHYKPLLIGGSFKQFWVHANQPILESEKLI